MSLLGAVAADLACQLKSKTKGWAIAPLVVNEEYLDDLEHNSFLLVKRAPPNISPHDFYASNPPTGKLTFLKIKQEKKNLRIISLRLEATVKYTIHIGFWRANGYVRHEDVTKPRHYLPSRYYRQGGHLDDHDALLLCQIHHVGPKPHRGRRPVYDHSFDLTSPEPPADVVDTIVKVVDKSYHWWGKGRQESYGRYQFPLMVDLDGKNYDANENHF